MSVNSSTDICNLALDLLSANTVQDIENPKTSTESLLGRWYDQNRRRLLREHPWNFAIKRIVLARDVVDPAFGYSAAFSVPSDFIRVLALSSDTSDGVETNIPTKHYQFEGNKILMNDMYGEINSVRMIYVYDAKTVSKFDPMFIDLLAYDLALSCAYKLTESRANTETIREIYKGRMMLSKAIDGQERPPTTVMRSPLLQSRKGGVGRIHRI